MRQQRVVENEAPVRTDIGQHEEKRGEEPLALRDEEHRADRERAESEKATE